MQPPRHVCQALYRLDPAIRLCHLGVPYEHTDSAQYYGEGVFGVVRIESRARYYDADGNRKTDQRSLSEALVPFIPDEMQDRHVTVFDKEGRPRPDYDLVTQGATLFLTVSPQWGLETRDVYGSRLVAHLAGSRKTQKEHKAFRKAQALKRGEKLKALLRDMAGELGEAVHYDVRKKDGARFGAETKEDRIARRKKREFRKSLAVGVERLQAWKEGLV